MRKLHKNSGRNSGFIIILLQFLLLTKITKRSILNRDTNIIRPYFFQCCYHVIHNFKICSALFYSFILAILCPYKVHFCLVLFKGTTEGFLDTGRVHRICTFNLCTLLYRVMLIGFKRF